MECSSLNLKYLESLNLKQHKQTVKVWNNVSWAEDRT